jgi:aromatic ring-opening dioxygenase catalytic subunit (LigB family)
VVKQPAIYLPHGGGPCFFMEWNPPGVWDGMERWLRGLAATITPRPKAILVISAHWEEAEFTLTTHPHPPLLYDYYGFPEHTYALAYPAPGSPALAARAAALLRQAGMKTREDAARGFDHGVFIPFLLLYPQADIPIVQLSLKAGLDPAEHLRAGEALAPLREEGVLIVGSGMSFHNLRTFGAKGEEAAATFDAWLTPAACDADPIARNAALTHWQQAPAARAAHPREEHLLPLMVVAGAAREDAAARVYSARVMGMRISAYRYGAA